MPGSYTAEVVSQVVTRSRKDWLIFLDGTNLATNKEGLGDLRRQHEDLQRTGNGVGTKSLLWHQERSAALS